MIGAGARRDGRSAARAPVARPSRATEERRIFFIGLVRLLEGCGSACTPDLPLRLSLSCHSLILNRGCHEFPAAQPADCVAAEVSSYILAHSKNPITAII